MELRKGEPEELPLLKLSGELIPIRRAEAFEEMIRDTINIEYVYRPVKRMTEEKSKMLDSVSLAASKM